MRAYGPGYGEMITQVANAASAAKPLPAPSVLEDEKSEHSPEEDIVDTKRKGRAESASSRGELDCFMDFKARMRPDADCNFSDMPRETRSSRHLRRRLPA
jgi:hypothetical protein